MKNFVKISTVLFIFLFFDLSAASDKNQIPPAVAKATQAAVKVNIFFSDGEKGHGSGFAVKNKAGKTFIVTNFHVTQKVLLKKARVKVNTLSGKTLKIKGVADFALLADLALLEVTDYEGPVLSLTSSGENKDSSAYLMGFPSSFSNKFAQVKIRGLVSYGKTGLIGFTYFSDLKGSSGGPLLNKNGAVIGVVQSQNFDYMVYFIKSHFVKKLLTKTRDQKTKTDSIQQFKEEVNFLLQSAKAGDFEAQQKLSLLYTDEELLNNPEESDKWNIAASQNGDTRTLYAFGWAFFIAKNYKTARLIWEKVAAEGHPGAMFNLSLLYMKGYGGPKDFKKGVIWLKKAAERENPEALSTLAAVYITGKGLAQDIKKGWTMLSELVEGGFSPALEILRRFNLFPLSKTAKERCHDAVWSSL